MEEAKKKKEDEIARRKQEEHSEEIRLKKEREELDEQFKREEAGKRKLHDDVHKANEDILMAKKTVTRSPQRSKNDESFGGKQ